MGATSGEQDTAGLQVGWLRMGKVNGIGVCQAPKSEGRWEPDSALLCYRDLGSRFWSTIPFIPFIMVLVNPP